MKHDLKNTLRALAGHFGLTVRFVHYFGDDVHGKLLPREKRILINARKPRCEHVFTLLHEIAHFVLHAGRPARIWHPRLLDVPWRSERLVKFCSFGRRCYRFIFNRRSAMEWEADLWAMIAFLLLTNRPGCQKELLAFLDRHPEKLKIFFLAAVGVTCQGVKRRGVRFAQALVLPFQILRTTTFS